MCIDCPLIQNEINIRLKAYGENLIAEHPLEKESIIEMDIIDNCWCEKTGGKLWITGRCSDYTNGLLDSGDNHTHSRNRKKNKRERNSSYKRKLEKLVRVGAAYYVDKQGRFCETEEKITYVKRIYQGNGKYSYCKYWKKISNRKIRRYKGDISKGFSCHKIFDYKWQIY